MTGMPHTIDTPRIRIGMPGLLRRALGLEAHTVVTPARAIVHCHLCGSPHRARANHFCPKLYGC